MASLRVCSLPNKFVFMSMCIHRNFMKTAVSLIASVPWPFLICNITILKKDLAASFLGILFPDDAGLMVWLCFLCLLAEFTLPYLVNAFVKYFYQVFLPNFSSYILVLIVSMIDN